jgi:hypothetical protein
VSNSTGCVVIVGGGLPGLFAALVVSERRPDLKVHLVERENRLGGLYNSFEDPVAGRLDHGMHVIYESCVEDVDRHIRACLRDEDWIFLDGNRKDIAGVFHGGKLREQSPYIDVRDLPPDIRHACLADLLLQLGEEALEARRCASARDFFLRRFGPALTDQVIEPVLQKFWRTGGANLDPMATRVVLMDRVCLFEARVMDDLMQSARIRARIAYPDQLALPLAFRSRQRGLYPRRFGMSGVIEAITRRLAERGVSMHTGADVAEIGIAGGTVESVRLKHPGGETALDGVRLLHWSIPLFGIAPKLGLRMPQAAFDPPLKQVYVYLLLKRAPRMGELYYFYCFDQGFRTYRVTNYAAYCPDARRPAEAGASAHPGAWPVCVELHFDGAEKLEGIDLVALATRELQAFGVIEAPDEIAYATAQPSKAGFPVLTQKNSAAMGQLRAQVESLSISNLVTAGQAPEQGIFFLHDVLEHSYNALIGHRSLQ